MTSAPKSDKITAALGPAMKLAKSTTFKPEKTLSLVIDPLLNCRAWGSCSPPAELWRAFFEEGGRPLLLVLGRGAESEVGSLKKRPLLLTHVHPFVDHLERQ